MLLLLKLIWDCNDLLSTQPKWELLTAQHPKFCKFSSQLPVLVVEWPKAGVKAPSKVPDEFKVCQQRWNGLSGVTFLPIGAIRLYALHGLDNALHYEISRDQLEYAVAIAKSIANINPQFTFQVMDPSDPNIYEGDNILCRYDLTPNTISAIPLDSLSYQLAQCAKKDVRRNSLCKDYGICGWNNASRDEQQCGLARPCTFKGTELPDTKQTFCALTQIIKSGFPNSGSPIYNDEERNEHFAQQLACENRIEAFRHAVSIVGREGQLGKPTLLSAHCDTLNEKDNLAFKWVCCISLLLYDPHTGIAMTHKFITYGKAAAGQYLERYKSFHTHLQAIKGFWNDLDPSLKYVSTDLIPPKGSKEWNILSSPHSMKTVLYSVHTAAINQLFKEYDTIDVTITQKKK
jgi:hypothetical protein